MKENFNNGGVFSGLWEIKEAEKVGSNCGPLSDGDSLYFDGTGPRQLVTVEMDLRNARLVNIFKLFMFI